MSEWFFSFFKKETKMGMWRFFHGMVAKLVREIVLELDFLKNVYSEMKPRRIIIF